MNAPSTGQTSEFMLHFVQFPVYVGSIPNVKDKQGLIIAVNGCSVMPYCHFHLEDSEYLPNNRRNIELSSPPGAKLRGTLDPNTKVIEFTSTGVGTYICR